MEGELLLSEKIYIPCVEKYVDMSPKTFEKFCIELIKEQMKNIPDVVIEHDKYIKTVDGNYQIDGYIEFTVMGLHYKTIVECKMYKNPVSREKVQKLFDTLRATGAQKGILISTSNFQSGAITYATNHGISLIQITEAPTEIPMFLLNRIVDSASYYRLYNNGNPFIGVLLESKEEGMITCQYLKHGNNNLAERILRE